MAAASSSVDPSEFSVSVALGYGHVLDRVLGFLERTSSELGPVLAVAIALPALLAYLVVVALAFAVRVAADSCAHVVLASAGGEPEIAAALVWQALAQAPAPVVKLVAYLVVFTGLAVLALLHFSSSLSWQLGLN